jgi:hypothetical protein
MRDQIMKNGTEVPYRNDIPEDDVERWVDYGRAAAQSRGLEIGE